MSSLLDIKMEEPPINKNINCNFLLIISAPSGTGKTTICNYLLEQNSDLSLSISATTRPPRIGEVDGKNYFFMTKEQFDEKKHKNEFLEYAQVFDNYYGTPIDFVRNKIQNRLNVLFDIDWQGMRKIKKSGLFNIATIFLLPPSIDTLRERLKHRGDSLEQIEKRIGGFTNDAEKANEYDYVVLNNDLEKTCNSINTIYKAEKIKYKKDRFLDFTNNHLLKTFL